MRRFPARVIAFFTLTIACLPSARAQLFTPAPPAMSEDESAALFARKHAPAKRSAIHRTTVAGEVLVEFREPSGSLVSTAAARSKARAGVEARALSRHGISKLSSVSIGDRRFSRVAISAMGGVEAAVADLSTDADVASVQPNFVYHTLKVPNDPQFAQQWGSHNVGQSVTGATYATHNPGVSGKDLGLEGAWDVATDCSSVPIAIVDTGINTEHEDLVDNLWDGGTAYPNHGYDFVEDDNNPRDLNGHGSHVAGIIAARGNNGVGNAGVCWSAKLIAVRALDASGSGTTENLVKGIQFAVAHGAKVINLSVGNTTEDPTFRTAIQAASDAGVIVVAAAGNDGTNIDDAISTATDVPYPCAYTIPNLVCVAALDQNYELARFSNYGLKTVQVGAPGTNILSTYAGRPSYQTSTFHAPSSTTLNWSTSGGAWAYGSRNLSSDGGTVPVDLLLNPSNWNGSTNLYAHNLDARTYTSFTIASALSVQASFSLFMDIDSTDSLTFGYRAGTGDPFTTGGNVFEGYNGSISGSSHSVGFELTACPAGTCTMGVRFRSGSSGTGSGVGIFDFSVETLVNDPASYQILDGTSMAAPAVTGLVALIAATNPSYTPAEVIDALVSGGTDVAGLKGKTTTGKAANAGGSITYLPGVKGLTAKVN